MTIMLQAAFVVASVLTWVAIVILASGLWRTRQGQPARELSARTAGQAALLFAGACLVTAAALRGFGDNSTTDVLLYAAVFGLAAASLDWLAEGATLRERYFTGRTLQVLSTVLPLSAGLVAGIVGTV